MAATTFVQLRCLGAAIRAYRTELGLSQEAFAERCDMHRTYLGEIERGRANVSFAHLVKIARAAKVKPSALWLRAGL